MTPIPSRNAVIDARRALDGGDATGIQHRPVRRGRTSLRRLGWRLLTAVDKLGDAALLMRPAGQNFQTAGCR